MDRVKNIIDPIFKEIVHGECESLTTRICLIHIGNNCYIHDNINDQIEGKTDFLLFHPKYVGNPNFCRNQLNLHLQSQMLNEVRENCFYVLWSCGKTNDPQFITTKKRQNGLGDPFFIFWVLSYRERTLGGQAAQLGQTSKTRQKWDSNYSRNWQSILVLCL